MALVARALGRRIYLDANVFIYALEGTEPWVEAVRPLFRLIDAAQCEAVTSELTLAEVLVRPMREENDILVQRYERLLRPRPGFSVVPVLASTWREAAALRAGTSLRLPDAVHLATAQAEGCDFVVSNDAKLAQQSPLPVLALG